MPIYSSGTPNPTYRYQPGERRCREPIHLALADHQRDERMRHTIARMGDADRAVEPGPDNGDEDNGDEAGARRVEVATLVAKLRDGVDRLRALPLEGVPPALGDRPWP
jgi:hypothetical protein